MTERFDPTCHPPFSRDPDFLWSREPAILAQEVGASVIRRLLPKWARYFEHPNSGKGTFGSDVRDALDKELTAALGRVLPAAYPSERK